ncbi:MAG TPA: DnaB-like helicase C-terminal domain-containing protein, partial [Candidatus Paceibacterota bacterium]|nr:DnaB-like helicase C-terminal domain-containing protein [Candidatus Paceibacterota bacterium]
RPNLESIQHSDQAGQDADVTMFLHPQADTTWCIVAKNRDGEKGDVALRLEGRYVRFVEQEDKSPTF